MTESAETPAQCSVIRVICAFCSVSAEYSGPAVGWNHGVGIRHFVTAVPAAAQGRGRCRDKNRLHRNHRNSHAQSSEPPGADLTPRIARSSLIEPHQLGADRQFGAFAGRSTAQNNLLLDRSALMEHESPDSGASHPQ